MAEVLQKRCDRQHEHQALVGGRCAAAAFYALGLIRAIIKGIRKTKNTMKAKEGKKKLINSTKVTGDKEVGVEVSGLKVSSIKKSGVGHVEIIWDDSNLKAEYKDECTGDILPPKLIKEAIIEELSYFNGRVLEVCTKDEMHKYKDPKLVRSPWVLCSKGDHQEPDVRARMVACEVNHEGTREEAFYAGTPPLEAENILCHARVCFKSNQGRCALETVICRCAQGLFQW